MNASGRDRAADGIPRDPMKLTATSSAQAAHTKGAFPMTDERQNPSDEEEELAQTAGDFKNLANEMADEGFDEMAAGVDDMAFAQDLSDTATAEAMAGASDLTRAMDAAVVADRLSTLSSVVSAAGVNDINQGADLIATAGDVDTIAAAVGLMTVDDLDKGLELGRLSGELRVVGNIVSQLEMPILAAFLGDRSERLNEIAIDTVLRAAASRSLTELIEATGQRIGEMGEEEIDEGVLRLAASDIAAERAADLTAAGLALGVQGLDELDAAAEDAELADEMRAYGVEEVARGAEDLGAAAAAAGEADALDESSKSSGDAAAG
jgi:hypothetical protein